MNAKILWCFLPLASLVSTAYADESATENTANRNPELYFYSCHQVDAVEPLHRDVVASSFDPNAVLLNFQDIEPILMNLPAQSMSGVGNMSREIAAELANVQDTEYRSQLSALLNRVKKSPGDFFGTTNVGDDLQIFWSSSFINAWYSEYKIETEECAVRRHSTASQSNWKLSDDWSKLKLIAEKAASPASRGVLGDIVEVSGSVSNVVNCQNDQLYRLGQCTEVRLESDIAVVNVKLSTTDLADVPTFQIGAMFESKECLVSEPPSIDTYDAGDAASNMSGQTLLGGALLLGELMGVSTGVSGVEVLRAGVVDAAAGSEAHVERLEISCSTMSLNPLPLETTSSLVPDAANSAGISSDVSEVSQVTQASKAVSDVLLLVEQGALERAAALIVIKKLVVEFDTSSRTQILATFVADKKLSGDELVQLLE